MYCLFIEFIYFVEELQSVGYANNYWTVLGFKEYLVQGIR